MAVTATAYLNGIENLNNGTVDWDDNATTTIKVALLTSSAAPNQDTDVHWSDVSANEITGTGYTAGGTALGSRAISLDAANNYIQLTGGNVSWTTSTLTARYAIVYKDTGTAATSPLLGFVNFGADMSSSAGTFAINWDATGVIRYTAA